MKTFYQNLLPKQLYHIVTTNTKYYYKHNLPIRIFICYNVAGGTDMKQEFDIAWNYFFKNLSYYFKIIFLVYIIFSFVAGLISYSFYFENFESDQITKNVLETFSAVVDANSKWNFFASFFNKFKIILRAFIFGFIPFLFLPLILIPFNSTMTGMLLMIPWKVKNISALKIFITFLPHSVFTTVALVIAITLGFKLSLEITKNIVKENDTQILVLFYDLARVFVFICLPLILMGNILELYLAPFLFKIL